MVGGGVFGDPCVGVALFGDDVFAKAADVESTLAGTFDTDGEGIGEVRRAAHAFLCDVFGLDVGLVAGFDHVFAHGELADYFGVQFAHLATFDDVADGKPHLGDEFAVFFVASFEAAHPVGLGDKHVVADGAGGGLVTEGDGDGRGAAKDAGKGGSGGATSGGVVEDVCGEDVSVVGFALDELGDLIVGEDVGGHDKGDVFVFAETDDFFVVLVVAELKVAPDTAVGLVSAPCGVEETDACHRSILPDTRRKGAVFLTDLLGKNALAHKVHHHLADALRIELHGVLAVGVLDDFDGVAIDEAVEGWADAFGGVEVGGVGADEVDATAFVKAGVPARGLFDVLDGRPSFDGLGCYGELVGGVVFGVAGADDFDLWVEICVKIGAVDHVWEDLEESGGHELELVGDEADALLLGACVDGGSDADVGLRVDAASDVASAGDDAFADVADVAAFEVVGGDGFAGFEDVAGEVGVLFLCTLVEHLQLAEDRKVKFLHGGGGD